MYITNLLEGRIALEQSGKYFINRNIFGKTKYDI